MGILISITIFLGLSSVVLAQGRILRSQPTQLRVTVAPPPSTGPVLYFSDCQAGAAAGCVPGNNSNPGTQASPKQNLSGIDLDSLAAGTTLLFARGGSWTAGFRIENPNARAASPITFADYGSGPLPLLRSNGNAFEFGQPQTGYDGGYVVRNLKLQGYGGEASFAIWLRDAVQDVTIEGVEITNYGLGIHAQGDNPSPRRVTIRNCHIHRNVVQGAHGKAHDALWEGNTFERNNPSGSIFNHGMYLSGGNNIIVRNNRFLFNGDTGNGQGRGGNMTFHGVSDNLLIENNLVEQVVGFNYGINVTPGYSSAESFTRAVVRNNTVINPGQCGVCVRSAPGILIESNRFFNTLQASNNGASYNGVELPAGDTAGAGDAGNENAVVRNNVYCSASGRGVIVALNSSGGTSTNNIMRTGAEATTGVCAR